MKTLFTLLLTGLLLAPLYGFAQNETNHWMFGTNGGLDFSTGSPVPESGCMLGFQEGTAAISDPVTGNLLMYTDGMTIYAANHTIMPNGTGLMGNFSSTQSALIVPKPGSSTLFYIFTVSSVGDDGAPGCDYSVVDMTLNGGLGDVVATQKNVFLFPHSGEQLSAVKHANCLDWWIMAKELGTTEYKAYLLTGTGVSVPVNSTIGIMTSDFESGRGQGKFSPDGTKYALCSGKNGLTQLFDFDNATGLLSNPITLVNTAGERSYGLSFSSDNSKLYITRGPITDSKLYQYDLSLGGPAAIIASGILLGDIGIFNNFNQLQLGKDFKIYTLDPYLPTISYISVINNPNALGAACGYSTGVISIPGNCGSSLCNFPDSYFNEAGPCSISISTPDPEEAPSTFVLHIPNVITTNGDGVNDVFKIDNLPPESDLCILNRWGNPVFTTDNYTNDWMGNKSDGVYFYMLKIPDGKTFSGFVEVITGR